MALAASLERTEGVERVGVMMATPANQTLLASSGMWPEGQIAGPDDLVVSVRAESAAVAEAALDAAELGLTSVDEVTAGSTRMLAATIDEGLRELEATVAAISTPGSYAPIVAEQALRRGLHVFCFSDNVSVEDEVRLKHLAADRRLLMMGPDCGTAMLDGVPLGFANAVRRGSVGIVAASGTGAQEVSVLLDRAGAGVSQIIGVGGRDLSAEVGAAMTLRALDLLAEDDSTDVVVLVSKPPMPAVVAIVKERLATLGKPAVACLVGAEECLSPVITCGTLEAGARAAASLAGHVLEVADAALPSGAPAPLGQAATPTQAGAPGIVGLYTGGTLAGEAKVLLTRAGITPEVLDLGDDEFTAGRPHPMISPDLRSPYVTGLAGRAEVGVLLVDVVLGHGSHADPASVLAESVDELHRLTAGRISVLASVTGTPADPQGLGRQVRILQAAGVGVHECNAAAVRAAIALVEGSGPGRSSVEEES